MEFDKSSETRYFYSVDTVSQLKEGKSEKKLLPKDFNDFERLLTQTSSILIPKAIGIYQTRQPTYDDTKQIETWNKGYEHLNKAIDLGIEDNFGITDNVHRDLIHLLYNSNILPMDLIKEMLNDNLDRIRISQLNPIPNFYEKEISLVEELLMESYRLRGEKDVEDVDSEVLNSSFTKLKPQAEEILKKLQPFGLTRLEWYDINSFFLFN